MGLGCRHCSRNAMMTGIRAFVVFAGALGNGGCGWRGRGSRVCLPAAVSCGAPSPAGDGPKIDMWQPPTPPGSTRIMSSDASRTKTVYRSLHTTARASCLARPCSERETTPRGRRGRRRRGSVDGPEGSNLSDYVTPLRHEFWSSEEGAADESAKGKRRRVWTRLWFLRCGVLSVAREHPGHAVGRSRVWRVRPRGAKGRAERTRCAPNRGVD
ncbi:hypothetical protein K438DRAFT_1893202 [Mycena galopus ATCC 62051]|nr:hypothetical protein K438DRAFT_1893202 [Mycena galopus ATCC 62051]